MADLSVEIGGPVNYPRVPMMRTLPPTVGIAANYPGDVNIELDPQVVFVERFDEATVGAMTARWADVRVAGVPDPATASTFDPDVPPGSPAGCRSFGLHRIRDIQGAHLWQRFVPGFDELYVRAYFKWPGTGGVYPQHSGIWIGGENPQGLWPDYGAGVPPTGSDKFIAGMEPASGTTTGRVDTYDYFLGMSGIWGNWLINDPALRITPNTWTCFEQRVHLNDPLTASNGEQQFWINGTSVAHFGLGFPHGTWNYATSTFTVDPNAPGTFEGFRWHTVDELKCSWVAFQNYADGTYAGGNYDQIDYVAHIVVATSYIGPLS